MAMMLHELVIYCGIFLRYALMGGTFSIDMNSSNDDITARLQIRQTVITVLISVHFLATLYLLCQTLVTGYCVVATPAGTTAVPHAIWLLAPFCVSFILALTTRFEVGLFLDTIKTGIYYSYAVLAVSIITNAVGLGLFSWELSEGVSNFYVQAFGFLIATIIVPAVTIVIELLLVGAVYLFHRDMILAIRNGWKPEYRELSPLFAVTTTKDTTADTPNEDEENKNDNSDYGGGGDAAVNASYFNSHQLVRRPLLKRN